VPRRGLVVGAACAVLAMLAQPGPTRGQIYTAWKDYERGNRALADGRYDAAEACFRKAVGTEPDFHAARNNLGVALHKQGRFDEALAQFQKVGAAWRHAGVDMNAGASHMGKGDADQALQATSNAVQQQTEYAEAFYNMGWIRDHRGEWPEAEKAYRQALAIRQAYPKAEIGLSIVLARTGRFEQALRLLDALLARKDVPPETLALATRNREAVLVDAAMANPAPADGAEGVTRKDLTLTWGLPWVDQRGGPAMTFGVRFAEDKEQVAQASEQRASGRQYKVPQGLETGADYYWQVMAHVADGRRAMSPVYSFTCVENQPPVLVAPEAVTTAEDTPVPLPLDVRDPEGDLVTFRVVREPARGRLSGEPPAFVYTPNPDVTGEDTLAVVANDGRRDSQEVTVRVQVTPRNDPPTVPESLLVTLAEDTASVLPLKGDDPEGQPLVFRVVRQPKHGSAARTETGWVYTPEAGYSGPDEVAYVASDGEANSATGVVRLTVTPVNDPPVARQPPLVETTEGEPVPITLSGSDPEGDALTFLLVEPPKHGHLTGRLPDVTYTPEEGFHGDDRFAFRTTDGKDQSDPAVVDVAVHERLLLALRSGQIVLMACGAALYLALACFALARRRVKWFAGAVAVAVLFSGCMILFWERTVALVLCLVISVVALALMALTVWGTESPSGSEEADGSL